MYIADFLPNKTEVVSLAMASPKAKPGSDNETLMRAVGDTVATLAKDKIEYEIHIDVSDAIAGYEVINGVHSDFEGREQERSRNEYESGLDDIVEASLEKYEEYLSADWLGRNTIDTRLWEDGAIEGFAKSAAKEVWKQLTFDKTPSQILANAGIVLSDVEGYSKPTKTGENTLSDNIDAVVMKVKLYIGKGYDPMAVFDDIAMVCEEDDEILCNAAAARIGMSVADVQVVQIAAMVMEDAPSKIADMVANAVIPSGRKNAAVAKAEKAVNLENAVPVSVFEALKECGASDTTMAESLGVSRSTYINYGKGKSPFVPEGEQYKTLRVDVVTRANLLLAALAALDGTEAAVVT